MATSTAQRIEFGKAIYSNTCLACHQANGEGLPNAFPPLAHSDILNSDVNNAIDIVFKNFFT